MGGRFTKRKTFLNAAGVAGVCAGVAILILLFIPRDDPAILKVRHSLTELSAPVIDVLSLPGELLQMVVGASRSYQSLVAENQLLRAENSRLVDVENELQRKSLLLSRYQALLQLELADELRFVGARVVADTQSPFLRTILIDSGEALGVRSGYAVLGAKGVVGRVISTGQRTSRVLLVTDLNSHIPVVIGQGRIRAIMSGTNRDMPVLEYFPKAKSISDGDDVLTSGDGGELPAGLRIGRAVAVGEGWEVELSQSPASLDSVRVVWTDEVPPPSEPVGRPRELQVD